MVPRVRLAGIPLGTTPDQIRDLLGRTPHTRYPIYERDLDHILGMVHIKDLLRVLLRHEVIGRAHARPLPLVPETAELDTVLSTMRQERTQMVIVLDEHGGTAGAVTLQDLFEEVVGDIEEGPARAPQVYRDAQSRLRVPGTMRIDELGQEFDLELEHEDVDSVSGLVLTRAGPAAERRRHHPVRPVAVRGHRRQGTRRRGVRGVAGVGTAWTDADNFQKTDSQANPKTQLTGMRFGPAGWLRRDLHPQTLWELEVGFFGS